MATMLEVHKYHDMLDLL